MRFNKKLLKKYAKVLTSYALNNGKGIKKGETAWVYAQQCSEPLFKAVCEEIWKAGGNVIPRFVPNWMDRYGMNRPQLELASDTQLQFLPNDYWEGIVKASDHFVFLMAQPNVHSLEGIPSEKVKLLEASKMPFMNMRYAKEHRGKLSWTLCLYPTKSGAKEAGMTLDEYCDQIINACYLREDDPVAKWREIEAEINVTKQKLDALKIKKIHIAGEDANLHITIGENRKWLGGGGHNIPSYEIFTSPDWRGTQGWMRFNKPLFNNGKRIEGIYLRFENGLIVEATATMNQDALQAMISQPNANRIGEFSWTPAGFSPINKFMAHTLFDENTSGEYGNTHIALGRAYTEAFTGDSSTQTLADWESLGFNNSVVHTDIISTTNRTITATLEDGNTFVAYKDGKFLI